MVLERLAREVGGSSGGEGRGNDAYFYELRESRGGQALTVPTRDGFDPLLEDLTCKSIQQLRAPVRVEIYTMGLQHYRLRVRVPKPPQNALPSIDI